MKLVEFSESHFEELSSWFRTEAEIIQWGGTALSHPLGNDQMHQMLNVRNLKEPLRLSWMAEENGGVIGHAQLALDWRNGNALLCRVAIAPSSRGKGLAIPMLRMVVDEGFQIPTIEGIELNVYTFNRTAIRAYEHVGFVREGVRRSSAKVMTERWDTLMMATLRSEWTEDL